MRKVIAWLLRVYSYLFHLLLSLFLVGIAIVSLASRPQTLKLGMLPWTGPGLSWWVLGLGIIGLICIFLAITGIVRFLFSLWTLLIFILILRGFFLSPFTFSGAAQFQGAIWLTIGALVAFLGSLTLLTKRRRGN
ncbi:MAG: hypothetical protein ACRD4P_16935 [Bryobacteraceae bacterium]